MTRFARASGSKSSNQRVPEESTPWSDLKQGKVNCKDASDKNQEKEINWKSVLDNEKKIEMNKNSIWCEFEIDSSIVEDNKNLKNVTEKKHSSGKKRKSVKEQVIEKTGTKNHKVIALDESVVLENVEPQSSHKPSKLKKRKAKPKRKSDFEITGSSGISPDSSKHKKNISEFHIENEDNSDTEIHPFDQNTNQENSQSSEKTNRLVKKKKRGKHILIPSDSNAISFDMKLKSGALDKNVSIRNSRQATNNVLLANKDASNKTLKCETEILYSDGNEKRSNNIKDKKNKYLKPYKRRKIDAGDVKLDINGQEIWVTRLDGFYIKREDAERIRELEKDLLNRGVSKQEVRAAIKKERRNAEKSLARQKKKVCFHCRKGGHTLSSCPKLEDGVQVVGSGICYKCGSTEHTHFQCKVVSGQSFKFAMCFICKQEGHISKQCPDNPRGIYPSGGGCRLCGDVTHFRRECPTLQAKSNKLTLGLIDQDVEALGDECSTPPSKILNKKKNKIIKFS